MNVYPITECGLGIAVGATAEHPNPGTETASKLVENELKWSIPANLRWLADQEGRPAYMPCGHLTGRFLIEVAERFESEEATLPSSPLLGEGDETVVICTTCGHTESCASPPSIGNIEELRKALDSVPIPARWESMKSFRKRSDAWLSGPYRAALASKPLPPTDDVRADHVLVQRNTLLDLGTRHMRGKKLEQFRDWVDSLSAQSPLNRGEGLAERTCQIDGEACHDPECRPGYCFRDGPARYRGRDEFEPLETAEGRERRFIGGVVTDHDQEVAVTYEPGLAERIAIWLATPSLPEGDGI